MIRRIHWSRSGLLSIAAICSSVVPRNVKPSGAWLKLSLSCQLCWTWSKPAAGSYPLLGFLKL